MKDRNKKKWTKVGEGKRDKIRIEVLNKSGIYEFSQNTFSLVYLSWTNSLKSQVSS